MKSLLDEMMDAVYGPGKRVVMHSSRVEACRAQFEEEFPRHKLIGSPYVPVDMVYVMPMEDMDG